MAASPVLVGRRAELAVARRLVDAVARGQGGTLLLTGEAGIGKSRLLSEVAVRAAEHGLVVLRGRAVPGGGTYRPLAEALARPLRDAPLLDRPRLRPFRSALRRVVPGWSDPVGGEPEVAEGWQGPAPDPAVVLGEGVLALLRELPGGERGCALLLEDLHWADAETIGLVSYLADAVPAAPVLLAVTARDEVKAPSVSALAAHASVTAVRLTRLDAGEVSALAAACRGGAALPAAELRALVARAEGLPFLVEELVDPAGTAQGVPPTLAALVSARLTALAPAAQPVLTAASVLGGDPDWRLLAAVTPAPESVVLDALRQAADVGLLAADGPRLHWRHALTRETVLATLLAPERAAIAVRAARVLEERAEPSDLAAAAELYGMAENWPRAARILVGLARRDADRGALHSADELLVRAASAGPATGSIATTVAAERVRVLALLGRVADAREVGTAALRSRHVAGEQHVELCLRLARAAVTGGRWVEAEGWLERAGRPGDPRALVLGADAAHGAGDVERAGTLAEAAVAALAGVPTGQEQAATLCEALMVRARAAAGPDLSTSIGLYRRAAQVAAEYGLVPWRVEALFGLGSGELSAGDPAAPALAIARELAVAYGMLARAVQCDLLRSEAVLSVDGPRAALPLARLAAERAGRLRLTSLQAMTEVVSAADAAWAGDTEAMSELLAAAASRADAPVEVATLEPMVRALPHLVAHDLGRANTLMDRGITALLPHQSAAPTSYFGLWVLVRTAVGDRDRVARDLLRAHRVSCALPNRAGLVYAEGVAAGRAGDVDTAWTRFTEADAMLAAMPWWNRVLRLIALEAAVADRWGDPVPALRADLAAHELAGEHAMARTCRDLLRAAGAPTRRGRGNASVPPRLRGLGITSREADVLALVTEGYTNAEIAARLFLSPRTVETHVARLLAKTGTSGRAELRAWTATHNEAR